MKKKKEYGFDLYFMTSQLGQAGVASSLGPDICAILIVELC